MAGTVFTVEKIPALLERARALLDTLGYANIRFRTGDGALGWPEEAPFEAIIVTAAPPRVPEALRSQLSVGGRLILPVGEDEQDLVLIVRDERGFRERKLISVRFVPLV
jgi:protein-L-isoaspartate(D-aspartate) O-methyltransferase